VKHLKNKQAVTTMQIRKLTLMSIASAALAAYLSIAAAHADDVKAGDLVISQA
jgi:hypothetical protein